VAFPWPANWAWVAGYCLHAHRPANTTASRHVLEKCGLTLVRTTPYDGPDDIPGAEQGEVEYALTRAGWPGRHGNQRP
jgi:hypothetical protein